MTTRERFVSKILPRIRKRSRATPHCGSSKLVKNGWMMQTTRTSPRISGLMQATSPSVHGLGQTGPRSPGVLQAGMTAGGQSGQSMLNNGRGQLQAVGELGAGSRMSECSESYCS